jgi:hypothetical protein
MPIIPVRYSNKIAQRVDLVYPRDDDVKGVLIGLCDIRAADPIVVEYDFDRDGWVILQNFNYDKDITVDSPPEDCRDDWREVAFVKAWPNQEEK